VSEEARHTLATGAATLAADRLREALSLWRGEPLADLQFEPFAQLAIERLEQLRTAALEERSEADLAVGRASELVPELEFAGSTRPTATPSSSASRITGVMPSKRCAPTAATSMRSSASRASEHATSTGGRARRTTTPEETTSSRKEYAFSGRPESVSRVTPRR
jgi:hypothetical protein